MDISPQRVRTAEFKTVKRGLDPDEVRAFLEEVATELERAQNQSTAMEARARAAVARLQELSEGAVQQAAPAAEPAPSEEPAEADVVPTADQADTISRTLLLAQRTADTTIADAEAQADEIRSSAEEEATKTIESTREMTTRLIDEAREEARRAGESERLSVESEVNSLMARRDFLVADVDHLEAFLVEERSRLREAASSLLDLTERVPGGLGEVRRPLLSGGGALEADADGASDATEELETILEAMTEMDDDAGEDGGDAAGDAGGDEQFDDRAASWAERSEPADEGPELDDDGAHDGRIDQLSALSGHRQHIPEEDRSDLRSGAGSERDPDVEPGVEHDIFDRESPPPREPESGDDQLFVQTDVGDDGPSSFSYDER